MVSDAELLEAAQLMEKALTEYTNPESDKWNPQFCGGEVSFYFEDLAKEIIKDRDEANGEKAS